MTALLGIETSVCDHWLNEVLSATPAVITAGPNGVWRDEIPSELPDDVAGWVYQNQDNGGHDTQAVGAILVLVRCLYSVRLIVPGEAISDVQRAGVAAMFTAINGQSGTAYGCRVTARRTGPLSYPEQDGQRRYRHIGGLFELTVTGV